MAVLAPASIGVEVLDSPDADPMLVRRMLGDITRSNRWLGGAHAVEVGLRFLLGDAERGASFRLLDVGTGAGDLPLVARRWAERRGLGMPSVGIERHRAAARLAHEHGVPCIVACGSALPFRAAIDIVLISQLLHHFDDAATITLIREAASVARHGVILTDLRPMRGATPGFRLAGRLLGLHPVTVSDGLVSIARGRSASALGRLAERAGASGVLSRDLPLARVVVAFRTAR